MIVTLLIVAVTILSLLTLIWIAKKSPFSDTKNDEIICVVGFIFVVGSIITASLILGIILLNLGTEYRIQQNNFDRESLIKQLESINTDYEDIFKSEVIAKVYEYNNDVYNQKYWAANPLTSWFSNQKEVNTLQYINMEDFDLWN